MTNPLKSVVGSVQELHMFPKVSLIAIKKMKRADTRESWLYEASKICVAAIKHAASELEIKLEEPENGYDIAMAPIPKGRCIGLCYGGKGRGEKARIVIDVSLECPTRVIHVLLHELVHAYTPGDGHRGRFPKIMKFLDSDGKMTSTVEGDKQAEWIAERVLPLLPEWSTVHSSWTGKTRGKRGKGSRLLKVTCTDCDIVMRASAKWASQMSDCPVRGCFGQCSYPGGWV